MYASIGISIVIFYFSWLVFSISTKLKKFMLLVDLLLFSGGLYSCIKSYQLFRVYPLLSHQAAAAYRKALQIYLVFFLIVLAAVILSHLLCRSVLLKALIVTGCIFVQLLFPFFIHLNSLAFFSYKESVPAEPLFFFQYLACGTFLLMYSTYPFFHIKSDVTA